MKLGVDYRVAISTLMDSAATYSAYNVKRVRRIMIKQDFTLSQSSLIFTSKLFFVGYAFSCASMCLPSTIKWSCIKLVYNILYN